MKSYNVHVYNTRDNFHDDYMVRANDPVDARGVAVRRLIDETGEGLDVWEIIDVSEIPDWVSKCVDAIRENAVEW